MPAFEWSRMSEGQGNLSVIPPYQLLIPELPAHRAPLPTTSIVVAAGASIGLLFLMILGGKGTAPLLLIAGLVASIGLAWAVIYTTRHTEYLVVALIMLDY